MLTRSGEEMRFDGALTLTRDDLLRMFRVIHTSRRIDDKEILLKRQNRIYFQISGAGHEAIQAAAGMVMRPGHDWFYLYYRDRALCLMLGMTPEQMLLQAVGAGSDRSSGGRQMPSHWSSPELHIATVSSPTGTQFLQAVGCAHAGRLLNPDSDSITLVTTGDGATSEGEFWEAMNAACLENLPLLFLVEDNHYAISVPVERQTAGGSVSKLLTGFPNLRIMEVDGTDPVASYRTMHDAAAHCRAGQGPILVHAHVIRPYSHSLSDEERHYKTAAERAAEADRDPFVRFPEWLVREGWLERQTLQLMVHDIETELREVTDRVLIADAPRAGSARRYLYSEKIDPCGAAFDVSASLTGNPRTMVDAINQTLHEEMERDARMVVFGEDVADCSHEASLSEVKGKGGVFKATMGLQTRFGTARCFNTPIAEAAIVGRAIGMATRGIKPVAEIQFFDYIWPAMMQIRNELATIRWRSNNGFSCPAVLRVPIGGYLTGGAIYHSQSGEVEFTHIPGLRVVMPSNALDACGLLRTAIRCDDPVLFLEHKKLYREPYNRAPHPGREFTIPFGKARTAKSGANLTIVTYGATVQKSMLAALQVEARHGYVTIEVLDLRSLAPYDWQAIAASVIKTSRVLIVHEDCLSFGYGAEIAARIGDELFDRLDAPVRRVAALDTWIGYNPILEDETLPQVGDIAKAAEGLLLY
jgi:2-oxoisovalerate dehydrogenase E1 component